MRRAWPGHFGLDFFFANMVEVSVGIETTCSSDPNSFSPCYSPDRALISSGVSLAHSSVEALGPWSLLDKVSTFVSHSWLIFQVEGKSGQNTTSRSLSTDPVCGPCVLSTGSQQPIPHTGSPVQVATAAAVLIGALVHSAQAAG